MKKKIKIILAILALAGVGLWLAIRRPPVPATPAPHPSVYDRYDYGRGDAARIVDIGTQPNDLLALFISEHLFHDRILQAQLFAQGWKLREHRYTNGNDMIPYADGRLDVMFLGDLPSFTVMIYHNFGIFALTCQYYNTIVATHILTPAELKGLRVGYPPGTTAHLTLEHALLTANLSFEDIHSVPMQPNQMEDALRNHTVDAVVTWDPTASSILANIPNSRTMSRFYANGYIAFNLDFTTRHPTILKALLAAVVRATQWAEKNEQNTLTGLKWVRQAGIAFVGKSVVEPNPKWVTLLHQEGITNPSFPMLPRDLAGEQGLLHQQFQFLKKIKILPATADWNTVRSRVKSTVLPEIIRDGKLWQIDIFDYAPDKLTLTKLTKGRIP